MAHIARPSVAADLVRGALGGAVATLVMSGVMLGAQRAGLMGTQPPKRIVERGAEATGTAATEGEKRAAAGAAHLAFGAAAGAAFGMLARALRPAVPEAVALPWAIAVWLVSYFGWIPALGILPRPTEDRAGRAWSMLAAHIVYGLALGVVWRALGSRAAVPARTRVRSAIRT